MDGEMLRRGGKGWDGERKKGERREGVGVEGRAQQLAPFFPCHYPWSLFQSDPFDESQIVH